MTDERFQQIVEGRIDLIREVLARKQKEYAHGAGRGKFHNFHMGGQVLRCTPEKALLGYMTKHLVSIADLVFDLDHGVMAPREVWREKIGDAINYLILLEGLVEERLE